MFAGQRTGEGVIALIIKKLPKLNSRQLFKLCGRVMLCSGPDYNYLNDIIPDYGDAEVANNNIRAVWQATAFDATRIGLAFIGKYVFNKDRIYRHFKNFYTKLEDQKNESKKVEAFVSRLFICGSGGHYYTAICGARKDRIAYKEEVPTLACDIPGWIAALVTAGDVIDVNGVPIQKIKDVYYPKKDVERAYRLICLGELRMLQHMARRARKAGDQPLAKRLLKEYLERKELYQLERHATWFDNKETSWQRTRHGSWIEWKKHERPVYNLSANERFDYRQTVIEEWGLTGVTPVSYMSKRRIPANLMCRTPRID